jgi:uncharacterized Fe-S center protein
MKPKVFFIPSQNNTDDELRVALENLLVKEKLLNYIEPKDFIAIKTHFGEAKQLGFARPLYMKMLGSLIKEKKGVPFLTETSTLYRGNRTNAVDHILHAHNQGFSIEETGLPIIMLDGLYGDEEAEVAIEGKRHKTVNIGRMMTKIQGMVMVSHFTGHLAAGFGATLKNLGMGCTSRKGKLAQHSTAKPSVNSNKCTACEVCVKWCPEDAISMIDKVAFIDKEKCIGCGQCLAMCRFDAVQYNWGATYKDIQQNIVEHAMGVHNTVKDKVLYINVLTRISKDCDCMPKYEKITEDIGILVSTDPVALDSASLQLVEERSGKKLSEMAFDIPYHYQIDYAQKIGFGSVDYELIEV